ncbi:family 20 glycosylhydrolase [Paenibacillus lignilyticus]|uniref:Family 20 glycosylhydrolase n=1 Tax=Paenibacillus lignilyticus TaxID=1172615 RepID=A0ABS5CDF5_9BACL|nr:family 20 glycosylhydrolase [Paenibacillus lignilyticus]MBP3963981.1 family 20 glycosylhydrolase [Paenibacillus lignilyticus]
MNDYLTAHAAWEQAGNWITKDTVIDCETPFIKEMLSSVACNQTKDTYLKRITFRYGATSAVRAIIRERLHCEYAEVEEGYVIHIAADEITVYAEQQRGLMYGAVTLSKYADRSHGYVNEGIVYNVPACPVRGLKVYLPTEDGIAYFKTFVDMLVHFKYNTIVIEVGGAMEYKKHPEINEGWVRYCEEMYEYSGKTIVIQEKTFSWYKNSIHAENGGGRFLSQKQVRELVDYCKERNLAVIPEVPCLSHCDYLLINHPEIRERHHDPYPDTYCPSDERSYELLFDVLDEVLDVFEPRTVHIGHDELYSIGLCDKCKTKPAEQLYADDIKRIYNYLQERGAQTMIWSEKLLNAVTAEGKTYGGSERRMVDYETGVYMGETIPATYKAIDLVPRDIIMMHWYWGIERHFDQPFIERGMPVVFGNFDGPSFADWSTRLSDGPLGGIISNWSALKEENLQRNGVLFSMAYAAYMFWSDTYDDMQHEETASLAFDALYRYRYREALREAGTSAGTSYVEVLHTTDHLREYHQFIDGIYLDNKEFRIGEYVLEYEDGARVGVPITYGFNISNKDRFWDRKLTKGSVHTAAQYDVDPILYEAAFTSLPVQIGQETFYKWLITNPYPDKTITAVRLTVDNPVSGNIWVRAITHVPDRSDAMKAEIPEPIRILGEANLASN